MQLENKKRIEITFLLVVGFLVAISKSNLHRETKSIYFLQRSKQFTYITSDDLGKLKEDIFKSSFMQFLVD